MTKLYSKSYPKSNIKNHAVGAETGQSGQSGTSTDSALQGGLKCHLQARLARFDSLFKGNLGHRIYTKKRQEIIDASDCDCTLCTAKKYAAAGLSVIPINPKTKKPTTKWKRYQTIAADDRQLERWFAGKALNLAVLAGKVSGNILWLDFDDKEAYQKWAKQYLRVSNYAPTQTTGKGYHVGVHVPDPAEYKNVKFYFEGEHVGEIRSNGGYIVASPSVHKSGRRYEWIRAPYDTKFVHVEALSDIGISTSSDTDNSPQTPKKQTLNRKKESRKPGPIYKANSALVTALVGAIAVLQWAFCLWMFLRKDNTKTYQRHDITPDDLRDLIKQELGYGYTHQTKILTAGNNRFWRLDSTKNGAKYRIHSFDYVMRNFAISRTHLTAEFTHDMLFTTLSKMRASLYAAHQIFIGKTEKIASRKLLENLTTIKPRTQYNREIAAGIKTKQQKVPRYERGDSSNKTSYWQQRPNVYTVTAKRAYEKHSLADRLNLYEAEIKPVNLDSSNGDYLGRLFYDNAPDAYAKAEKLAIAGHRDIEVYHSIKGEQYPLKQGNCNMLKAISINAVARALGLSA